MEIWVEEFEVWDFLVRNLGFCEVIVRWRERDWEMMREYLMV